MAVAHPGEQKAWWRRVTPYQWFVFGVVSAAWLLDNMEQRLFSLARIPALIALAGPSSTGIEVQAFAKQVTALFLIGWGIGGLAIGALGDRFGRVRLLVLCVLVYGLGTALTALCSSPLQFAELRVITGFGIGGLFGLVVAIITEVVPTVARVPMLGLLQVASAVGNIGAAITKMGIDWAISLGQINEREGWRWVFGVGAFLALIAVVPAMFVKESDAWLSLKGASLLPKKWYGSYRWLLSDKASRSNLIFASLLSIAGVVGLWGIGEYAVDLQHAVFTEFYIRQRPGTDVTSAVSQAKNLAYLLQMLGAVAGMLGFTYIASRVGRRPAFAGSFLAAFFVTVLSYWDMKTPSDAYWMMPLMGATQLGLFAGYAIYLPELFSANVRSTAASFAYNVGRFAAAAGSYVSAAMTTSVFGAYPSPLPLRYSAMSMCAIFLVGFAVSLFAPETRGKALPN